MILSPRNVIGGAAAVCTVVVLGTWPVAGTEAQEQDDTVNPWTRQSQEDVDRKNVGCVSCHEPDTPTMHVSTAVRIACVDCHGGNGQARRPAGADPGTRGFEDAKRAAHVQPRLDIWKTSANPINPGAATLKESREFIRFVNPGDLRAVGMTCGTAGCHAPEADNVWTSMMTHSAMLWGAALYNNGAWPSKTTQFGEFYTPDGQPAMVQPDPPPSPRLQSQRGILAFLQPLLPWETSQPGNVLRIFERGGRLPIEIGIPDPFEEPGLPANRLSDRGFGTLNRTDPVFIGLQKTRLMDPTLNMFGTNDQPGDYRSSGCTACHVVYANDRSPVTSAQYASAGNRGMSQTTDPMIPKNESGHPISHTLTRSIPTSQCIVCHMHPGTNVVTTYTGFTWWDDETDGDKFYPEEPLNLSAGERSRVQRRNPQGSVVRGLWSDVDFLAETGSEQFNRQLSNTQIADYHGHGWLYKAVFKRDRKGNLLDAAGDLVPNADGNVLWESLRNPTDEERETGRPGLPVHLKDIHLERGMQCVDCHFSNDAHGDGNLYGETRAAIEIACEDCHGTAEARATLLTTGPAAPTGGTDLTQGATPFGLPRFQIRAGRITQRSMMDEDLQWLVPQVADSITPGSLNYNELARLAKTIRRDGSTWGTADAPDDLAHGNDKMTCYACHSSWMTSCFGCHLSQRANEKRPNLHNEGATTKNWTEYNFQVIRDDVYMLGIDSSTTGNRIAPVRSSSAVVVSSQDQNRQWVYSQQQTVSSEGYAGQAFNTHVPHTVRTTETKGCTDCHVSAEGDNNAVMAQLLLQGTNFVNFMGRFIWVATGDHGVEAISVTEQSEPQAVIGSDLHRLAYPDEYAEHLDRERELEEADHHGSTNALDVQMRGEYLYIADGSGGFRVFDVAQIYQKGFSEKIVTAPVSPIGQNTNIKTRFATAVASPTTLAVDPARVRLPENQEQPIHPMYAYIYITDREEGLVLSTAATLLDGNPENNFLERATTFNPDGILDGAVNLEIAGHYAYILCDRGLVIVNIDDPLNPQVAAEVTGIRDPRAVAIQFRYAFVTDADGMKVVDITTPERPRLVESATTSIADAQGLYVARTYAYVAAGSEGLVIVDVERPERPRVDQTFNAGGAINDSRDVKVAMTNASVFAYIADGVNGLQVVQLVSANDTPGAFGFSPRPAPQLIATHHTGGPALAISKGLDRDRAVDETGHQVAVFGRRGGRPFNAEEMRRLYVRDGEVWTVSDEPQGRATDPQ